MSDGFEQWLETVLGHRPRDRALFVRAVTHSSHGDPSYERLEFLGDRVLGLVMASALYALFPQEAEGKLSRRFHALVSGESCAEIAREIGVAAHLRLGKQGRDNGAEDSDNVLGDVVEALVGALFVEAGYEAARSFVERCWGDRIKGRRAARKHPKAALQELAAAKGWQTPVYALADRSGPEHAPTFEITVSIHNHGEARGTGSSKQEAETAAARALTEQLGR